MTKPVQIDEMVRAAEERFGTLDILVNNAGIQFVAPVDEFPSEKWEQIIGINLSSNFYAIRAALPGMKQRNHGCIVNIASAHGLVASPFKTAYVAAVLLCSDAGASITGTALAVDGGWTAR